MLHRLVCSDNGKSPLDAYDINWECQSKLRWQLLYNPHRTKFVQDAELAGKTIGGSECSYGRAYMQETSGREYGAGLFASQHLS